MWAEIDFRMKVSPQFDYNINNIAKIFLMRYLNGEDFFFNSEEFAFLYCIVFHVAILTI